MIVIHKHINILHYDNLIMVETIMEYMKLSLPVGIVISVNESVGKFDMVVCISIQQLNILQTFNTPVKKILYTGAGIYKNEFVVQKIKLKDISDTLILTKPDVTITNLIKIIGDGLR